MAEKFSNYKNRTYLNINKDGMLYSKSNESDRDATKVVTDKGEVLYHVLYTKTDRGLITNIQITEDRGFGKQFQISLESSDNLDIISVPLLQSNGQLNNYVRNFTQILPNIDFSKTYTISPNRKKNDRGYVYKNLYVNYDDTFVKNAIDKEDLPEIVVKEKVGGGKAYDTTDLDNFLFEKLEGQIKRLQDFLDSSKPELIEESTHGSVEKDSYDLPDDLPF